MTLKQAGLAALSFVFGILATAKVDAQTYTYSLYVDSSAASGCNVPEMTGADVRLQAQVTGGAAPQVVSVDRALCNGATFGAGTPIGGGYPVGINNGTAGADVIELADSLSALRLGTNNGALRLALVANSATGQDTLLATSTGGPIVLGLPALPIPALAWPILLVLAASLIWFGARRARRTKLWRVISLFLLTTGIVLAANFVTDGQVADWAGVPPLATDPAGDSTSGESAIDIVALFGATENGQAFFRIDVRDLQNNPPIANPVSATTLEDQPVTVTLTATDPDSATVTFAIASAPANGVLGPVTPAGPTSATVSYTPNPNFNGNDSFTFTANDGQGSSAPATVSLTITPVNDAPGFTRGADVGVAENAGLQTIPGWATAITPGPADEAAQTVIFAAVVGPTTGTLTFGTPPAIASNGTLTFAATNGTSGTATISVTVTDNGGTANGGVDTSAAQTFTIAVNAINHAPSFVAGPSQTVLEDAGAQSVNPWATAISDGDGNTQTLTFNVTGNTNAALFSAPPAIAANGALTYTPAPNANGTATITIVLQDNGGTASGGVDTSPSQTFTITVTAVNDAPGFTAGPNASTFENAGPQTVSPWATGITTGPADESAQTVTFNVTNNTNPALFSAGPAIAPNGTLTYTPAPNVNGVATITLAVQDSGGTANGGVDTSPTQTFTITVAGINHAPTFVAGPSQTTLEDSGPQTQTNWATAISDGDGNTQTLTFNVTGNDNAALFSALPAIAANGTLTYTPAPNANGIANITITLSDNGGTANGGADTSAPASFSITVTAVNDQPSLAAINPPTVNEDAGAQTVATWATFSAGPANESSQTVLGYTVSNISNGALFSVAPSVATNGTLTYTPAANASGTSTFDVVVQDSGGVLNGGVDTSVVQTFTITVTGINDAPSFTPGASQTVLEDAAAQNVPWATAISAGAGEAGQVLTFNVTANDNPTLFSAGPAIDPVTGNLSYTLTPNANGIANLTITLSDNGGTAGGGVDTSAPASFSITVTAVNDQPGFTAVNPPTINEDAGAQTVATWATFSAGPANESGQTVLGYTVSNISNGALFAVAPSVATNGTLTYTPATNVSGTSTFDVVVQDSGGILNGGVDTSVVQTFTITVTGINDAPSFTPGPNQTVLEDAAPQNVPWATAISDGDGNTQTLTFNVTGNDNAALFASGPAVNATTGNLSYTLAANANGIANITITLSDDGGVAGGGVDTSAPAAFSITVTAVNDQPSLTAVNPPTIIEDAGAQTVATWATFSAGPANESGQTVLGYTVSNISNGALFAVAPSVATNGTLTYTPAANASGTSTFDVVVQDSGGVLNGGVDTSVVQTFTITISAVDDAPVAVADTATVVEDAAATTINVLTNDTDIDGGAISVFSVTQPLNGVVLIGGGGANVTYQPNANYCNSVSGIPDTFNYTLTPGSSSTTVSVTVTCVDDNPVAVNDAATITEDDPATAINVLGNDTDVDAGPISIQSVTQPTNGVVVITGLGTGLTYQPNPNYCNTQVGGTPDTFTYTLTPGGSIATVSVTVTCVPDNPVAVNDAATVTEDAAATTIDVRANDSNPDATPFTIQSVTQPANGTVVITGGGNDLTYLPNPNYCNTQVGGTPDTFTYTLTPGGSTATVSVTVTCVDDPPVAVDDAFTLNEDAPTGALAVLGNDTDVDGGPISIQSVTQPPGGLVTITGGGTGLNFTPTANYCNTQVGGVPDTFTYTLTPGGDTATVSLTITCINDPPTLTPPGNIPVHTHIAISVANGAAGDLIPGGGIVDPDSSNFTIQTPLPTTSVGGGELVINGSTGAFTYNPPANFAGTDTFSYAVCDDGTPQQCSTAVTVNLVVTGPEIWFVDDDAVVVGTADGTLQQPLSALPLAAAQAVTAGDTIFVHQGNYTAGVTLANGVRLVGHAIDAATVNDFDGELTITPPTHSIARPLVDQTAPMLSNAGGAGITLGSGNTVRGVTVSNGANTGILGAAIGTLTVFDDVTVTGSGPALNLTGGTFAAGSVFVTVTSTGGANNVLLTNVAGTVNLGTGTLSGATGASFQVAGGAGVNLTSTYSGTITKSSAGAMIDIANHTAGTILFQTGALNATAGTGVQLSNVDGTVNVTSQVTLNGGDAAIDVLAGSSGTVNFSNTSSMITNPTNEVVTINSSSPTFTYAGSFSKTNAGIGIRANNNTAGTYTFSGTTKTLTTGASDAVQLNANGTAITNFTGGNLVLTTTSGDAFDAATNGSISVQGTANRLTSSTGAALNILDTQINAGNVNLESINSTGASGTTAVALRNTGTGTLTVNGTGGAGTGGTISNKTVDAVQMNNTDGAITLRQMVVQDIGNMGGASNTISGHDAIHAQQVDAGLVLENVTIRRISDMAIHGALLADATQPTVWNGLTITNSTIEDTNRFDVANVGDANNEGMIRILGIRGVVNVSGSTLQRGGELMDLFVNGGTMTMNATTNAFNFAYKEFTSGPLASVGGHCIDVTLQGAGDAAVTVGHATTVAFGNTFLNCRLGSVRIANDAAAAGDADVIIANNTFTVNDHSSGIGGDFDFPQGGVNITSRGTDAATFDVAITNNIFDEITNASGGVGQISFDMDGGIWQTRVEANTFDTPGNAPWFLRADGTPSARSLFRNNNYIRAFFTCPDPSCAGGYFGPGLRTLADVQNGGVIDLTIDGDDFAMHDTGFDPGQTFEARVLNVGGGGTLCLGLLNNTAPDGYSLEQFAGTFNLSRGAGAFLGVCTTVQCQGILQANNNRGGGGVSTTNPPFTNLFGTVNVVAPACQLPVGI